MGVGMKRAREEETTVSLALSLTTDSTSSTTSADSPGGSTAATQTKRPRRGRVVATSGEGDFVCKTCGRAFVTFRALGGHRTSHLRGRHGLELGVGVAKAIKEKKRTEEKQQHECHICGLGFETGQALGGHMRRHRNEMALSAGADNQWIILQPDQEEVVGHAAHRPPVLLELFV
ncbi:zinc finger protein ZAT5-like [Lolium rigidum]|uniref:zinc finger protein ZAT5-like n=1 Tax=Lolium rigidum TaxID=89674 RepID=UPI001F5DA1C7|nr:zinc finger protein ZAT5-like [Lolium rigidum]